MKTSKHRIPILLLLGKVLIVSVTIAVHAQAANANEPAQVLHQELTYCAKQLDYTPVQLLQLKQLKQQQNLSQEARFQSYLKILTPAQQQELAQCAKTQTKHAMT
jgi:hypothetical protein